jgi:hypothetical protein
MDDDKNALSFTAGLGIGALISFIVIMNIVAAPLKEGKILRDEWARNYFQAPGQEVYFDLDKKAYVYRSLSLITPTLIEKHERETK